MRKYSNTIALAVSTILIFTPLAILSYLFFIIFLASYLPLPQRTKSQRIVWSYVFVSIFVAILYMLTWLGHIKLSPGEVLEVLALTSWIIHITRVGQVKNSDSTTSNWWTVGPALIVALFVCLPLIRNPSSVTVLRYAAHTVDDINHLTTVEADRQASTYLYRTTKYSSLVPAHTASYPQGWHINGALLESLTVKLTHHDTTTTRLVNYFFYKTLWLFIATFFVAELIQAVSRSISSKLNKYSSTLLTISAMALSTYFLIPLYGYGFQTYIANLALLLAAFVLAIEFVLEKNSKQKNYYLIGMGLLTVGTSFVWILSGLTLGLLTLTVIITSGRAYLRKFPLWAWLILAISTSLALLQIVILRIYGVGHSLGSINSGGVAPPINEVGIVIIFALTAFTITKYVGKQRDKLLVFIVITSLEYLALMIYQQIKFGGERYYVIKLGYGVALICSCILLPISLAKLNSLHFSLQTKGVAYLIILVVLPFVIGLNVRKSAYPLKDHTPIQPITAKYILTIPKNDHNVIIRTNSKEESFLATKLWSGVWLYNNPTRQVLLNQLEQEINH